MLNEHAVGTMLYGDLQEGSFDPPYSGSLHEITNTVLLIFCVYDKYTSFFILLLVERFEGNFRREKKSF